MDDTFAYGGILAMILYATAIVLCLSAKSIYQTTRKLIRLYRNIDEPLEPEKGTKGYKGFNLDLSCRPHGSCFFYEVGKTYEQPERPRVCGHAFHFCLKLTDVFNFYNDDGTKRYCEIEALGEIATDGIKYCTNRIRIVRELTRGDITRITQLEKYGCKFKTEFRRKSIKQKPFKRKRVHR